MNDKGHESLERIEKYTDFNEMLARERIDIVIIATESGYHANYTVDCLNQRKHVLVEKPMALSIKDADKMIEAAKTNNVKLGVCYQNRFNYPIQKLKEAMEEGRFGKLVHGTARILWNRNDNYYEEAKWRGTLKLDGGTLMNQCIHNIDLLQWVMDSEIDSVYAETDTFLRNIEGEDFGTIIIRFKNGSVGIVEGSVCVYPKNLEETLSIFGEKGTVVIGGSSVNEVKFWRFPDTLANEKEIIEKQLNCIYRNGHTYLYKEFIDAIRENREPLINGEEGKKSLEIVLGAYKSQRLGRKVVFPIKDMDIDIDIDFIN